MFAAEPPPWKRIAAGASLPRASGSDRRDDHVDHHVAEDDDPAHAASSVAISAASRAFRTHQPHVRLEARALGLSARWSSRNGVTSLPLTPAASAAISPSASTRSCRPGRAAPPGGSGFATTHRAPVGAELLAAPDDRRDLRRRVGPPRHRVARVGEVEAGEAVACRSRAPSRSASRAARASRPRRGSTSRPRRRPRCRCARASRGRPTRPRCRARRGERRRSRRSRRRGCPRRAARCAVAATVVPP